MNKGYIAGLDGIRFFAVLLVLIDHWSGDALPFPGSYLGVCLFFVLSGFLITRILLNAKKRDEEATRGHSKALKQFYIRRTIRIFPIYYLTLGVLFLFNVSPVREKFWWLFTYNTNNYIAMHERWLGSVDHLWSLAVEEQFYLFFPFLILFLDWKHIAKMLYVCIVVSVALRLFFYLRGDEWMRSYVLMFTCLDAFGIGGLFAYYAWRGNERLVRIFSSWWPILAGVSAYTILVLWSKSSDGGAEHGLLSVVWLRLFESILSIAFIGKIVTHKVSKRPNADWFEHLFANRAVVYVGQISYGIYIYHNFIYNYYHTPVNNFIVRFLDTLQQFVPNPEAFLLLKITFLFGITVFFASLSWFLIEKPINNLKERFTYS